MKLGISWQFFEVTSTIISNFTTVLPVGAVFIMMKDVEPARRESNSRFSQFYESS
jgi:hypothetical protein